MNDKEVKNIVILGGGFGGVRVGLDLANRLKGDSYKVTLVNKTEHHDYHADLYEIAGTFLPEEGNKRQKILLYENLEGTVSVGLEKIFEGKNVEIIIDEVADLDLRNREVKLSKKPRIKYEILVLALGSTTNYFGIPHLEERSLPLKSVEDALNIRNQIDELFIRQDKDKEINILIGGGGFTGCELAGELPAYLVELAKLHGHELNSINFSIVEACPSLLNGVQEWVQEEAKKRLTHLGVKLYLENKIIDVKPNKVILESGKDLPFDLLIWTAGVKANPIMEQVTGVKLEKNNCLAVDKYLRIITYENVYATGDNSYCYDYERNCFVPPTAQLAIAQGKKAAENIIRSLEGKSLEDFKPQLPNFIIPLGKGFALGQIPSFKLKGLPAWWLKRFVALKYFISILPPLTAFTIWWRGNRFFTQ